MKVYFFAVLMLACSIGYGQSPRVPSKMEFAGLKLRITEGARKEIQKDVDALTKYPKYYEIKAEKARSYFPIIERVFKEENLPEDFKYLVLQESALIPDAVSSSNAVGFWQFKDFTALEVGLKINRYVDERMNIVSSSIGAARYMKKNNNAFFGNWLHALQAYQSGAGAALKVLDKKHRGATSMVVDKKTYWYVKKYLAHKIAFESVMDKPGKIRLLEYYGGAGKSLKEVAAEANIEEQELAAYNKWLKKGRVPSDKAYAIIIPNTNGEYGEFMLSKNDSPNPTKKDLAPKYNVENQSLFPRIKDKDEAVDGEVVTINGLPGILASSGDEIPALAKKGKIDLSKFLKYNDLKIDSKLVPNQVYYLKRKRSKAKTHYHVVDYGETLWSISQKYGIKVKKLVSKNRLSSANERLKPGRVLWLRYIRPASTEISYKELPKPEVPVVIAEKTETVVNQPKETERVQEIQHEIEVKSEDINEETASNEEVEENTTSIKIEEIDQKLDELNSVENKVEEKEIDSVEDEVETEIKDEVEPQKVKREIEDKKVDAEKPFAKSSVKTHVIASGQTFYYLSKLYNVEVVDILEWNNLDISDKLSIGQELIIRDPEDNNSAPEEKVVKEEFSYHTVQEGEGLYGIARSYNVTIQQVMDWNEKENFDISIGEKLKIKKKVEENEQ